MGLETTSDLIRKHSEFNYEREIENIGLNVRSSLGLLLGEYWETYDLLSYLGGRGVVEKLAPFDYILEGEVLSFYWK